MNTHIIIPIKDIEALKQEEINAFAGDYQTVKRYERLIEYAKQISLDEKDIDITKFSLTYINSKEEKGKAEWNSKQFITYDLCGRVKKIPMKVVEFLQKKLRLTLSIHKQFGFEAGYKQAIKDLIC